MKSYTVDNHEFFEALSQIQEENKKMLQNGIKVTIQILTRKKKIDAGLGISDTKLYTKSIILLLTSIIATH